MGLAGFKYLKTYQLAVIIFDLNMEFVRRYINYKSRTKDQMEQAGRSGKQNIAEGYLERSLKMYIKLVGVSRGSFGELLEDYEDFARLNKIPVWNAEKGRNMGEMKEIWGKLNPYNPYAPFLPDNPEAAVNLLITLLNQENYLLDRQIKSLEEKFTKEGGYSENLFKKRLEQRDKR